MKNQANYSLYKCPYEHIEKGCGHELIGPEGYENTYGVWCACGFRGPVFCLDPDDLNLEKKDHDVAELLIIGSSHISGIVEALKAINKSGIECIVVDPPQQVGLSVEMDFELYTPAPVAVEPSHEKKPRRSGQKHNRWR